MYNATLYLVIPCYNEHEILKETIELYSNVLKELIEKGRISEDSSLFFVDDGSTDKTWYILKSYCQEHEIVKAVSLTRNEGHQSALFAGLLIAKEYCDVTISVDCDGQDDLEAIDKMLDWYYEGNSDIVYGVRTDRGADSVFKRLSAELYYLFVDKLNIKSVKNHADFRLVSSTVLKSLEAKGQYKDMTPYLRGMFPLTGFNSSCVVYKRKKRIGGKSHYSFGRMLSLAMDGITGYTLKPIQFLFYLSITLLIIGVVGAFATRDIIYFISLFSGLNIFSLWLLGEYIGRIYRQVKHVPRCTIKDTLNLE